MARFSLDLSDGLRELRGLLGDYSHEPRILDPEDARALMEVCAILFERARKLENEISAAHWNAAAERDRRAEAAAVLAAASAPESNVRLFPAIARPFGDGRPGGGA